MSTNKSEKHEQGNSANLPAKSPAGGPLSSHSAYAELPEEERQALAVKYFEQQLELNATSQRSEQDHLDRSRKLQTFVDKIADLDKKAPGDVDGVVEADGITIKYKKNNSTVIIVIAAIVALLAFFFLTE
jgi:hypothetical protein